MIPLKEKSDLLIGIELVLIAVVLHHYMFDNSKLLQVPGLLLIYTSFPGKDLPATQLLLHL